MMNRELVSSAGERQTTSFEYRTWKHPCIAVIVVEEKIRDWERDKWIAFLRKNYTTPEYTLSIASQEASRKQR
jgi:hypothetical protein